MSSIKFQRLLSPYKLGTLELKNRMVFLAHHTGYGYDGMMTDGIVNHYVERAKGGAAAVFVSQAAERDGRMSPSYLVASDRRSEPYARKMSKESHRYGCKVLAQLTHQGHTTIQKQPITLYAPTQMPGPHCHYNTKELEIEEIESIKNHFVEAAVLQREWGFDGVELKVAHDGLLRTFVSPYLNRREDEYGGSFENRIRFPLEIISSIRKEVGDDYPIGIRLCMDEFTDWGYSHDYGLKLAKAFEDAGVDFISNDVGTFSSFYMEIPPALVPLNFSIYISALLKERVKIPVIAFGRINDAVQMETILEEKTADIIGMCRQLICDPETPNKILEGREEDIRNCIACNDACQDNIPFVVHCMQNPGAGREGDYGIGTLCRAKNPMNIMVVGGGLSGMKTAEILAKRGHKVEIYEKDGELGGQMLLAQKVPLKTDLEDVTRYIKKQLIKMNVKIYLNKVIDLEYIRNKNPDAVVIATGSHPVLPNLIIEGETGIKIITPNEALSNIELIGKTVVIYDDVGYWQGIGVAYYAAMLGAKVIIVTPDWKAGSYINDAFNEMQHKLLYSKGADIVVSHKISSINGSSVNIENKFNHKVKEIKNVDTLIIATHSVSDNELYKQLKAERGRIYSIGDCVSPRRGDHIIFESEKLARSIG